MHAVLVVDAWPENHESSLGRSHAVGSFKAAKIERVAFLEGPSEPGGITDGGDIVAKPCGMPELDSWRLSMISDVERVVCCSSGEERDSLKSMCPTFRWLPATCQRRQRWTSDQHVSLAINMETCMEHQT